MYQLSYFHCDVTPPLGHPLCGGWITPVTGIVDRQSAHGIILSGVDLPIVLVTVDWCEIRNSGYDRWRAVLAETVGTTADHVFVHTVHQHDAILADPDAEVLLRESNSSNYSLDLEFFEMAIQNTANAARVAMSQSKPITHISTGQAEIEKVASNRRVMKDANGKVETMRGSSCTDEKLRDLPEGLIDPFLKTIGFWNGDTLLAAMHYYATHPMSYYGKGQVSCDFCGLARDQFAEETGAPQLYFTGGAGNIAAGKYNDGTPEMRPVLTGRILEGMRQSLQNSEREPLESISWQALPVHLTPRAEQPTEVYQSWFDDSSETLARQTWAAMGLAWLNRVKAVPDVIDVTCLHLNETRVVHLPGEPFVEYQLFAQQIAPEKFVAFAGYGDGGTGYIPTAAAYEEGGYEASFVAFTAPDSEEILQQAMRELVLA